MRFTLLYKVNTRVGPFFIGRCEEGRFHPIYKDESYGSYWRAAQAAEDLAGGHTFSIPGIGRIEALGIPSDLDGWEQLRPHREDAEC